MSLLDTAENIACLRRYEVGSARSGYRPSYPQVHPAPDEQTESVTTTLEFENTAKARLGVPLPAGRVRVFQADASGESLLGEAALTRRRPDGALTGMAFDLTARRNTDFRWRTIGSA